MEGSIKHRMGAHHTIYTFLAITNKLFQDARWWDLFSETSTTAEGSVAGVTDGHKYNRTIGLHKLVYEALMHLA